MDEIGKRCGGGGGGGGDFGVGRRLELNWQKMEANLREQGA